MHWYTPLVIWGFYHLACLLAVVLLWATRQISHAGALELSDWFVSWRLREGTILLGVAEQFTRGRVLGMSIGLNVLVRGTARDLMRQTAKHEECHCIQQLVLGPLMPALYLLFSLFLWARGKKYYLDNPFEVQARRYASRP